MVVGGEKSWLKKKAGEYVGYDTEGRLGSLIAHETMLIIHRVNHRELRKEMMRRRRYSTEY